MRRRSHPARRARRVVGTLSVGAYAGAFVAVGVAQRAGESGAEAEAGGPAERTESAPGVERLDLAATATFLAPPTTARPGAGTVPIPPPPPSVTVTTTTAPVVAAPGPVASPAPPVAPPATTVVVPPATVAPATTAPPPTTTTVAPTTTQAPEPTIPPSTTVPNGAS